MTRCLFSRPVRRDAEDERPTVIAQCERDAGHPGTHRYPGPITWTTLKETPNA